MGMGTTLIRDIILQRGLTSWAMMCSCPFPLDMESLLMKYMFGVVKGIK